MVHHEWFMIVTWLCIMYVDLSDWEDWYVSNESQLVLMIVWRLCCVDHVFRLVFSRWCLLTCKSILSTSRCRKTPCILMKYKMRQFVWRTKYFVGIIFNLVWFVFKIDGFLGLWQDVAGKFLQPLESWFCWRQRVQRGTWFSVGRLAVFQAQREQWVSSSQRAVVEGHIQLQCKACPVIQVIVEKDFQVESVDRTWKKNSIEDQTDNHKLLWVQKPFSGKVWSKSGPRVKF